jgi:hypothetical protein
MDSVVFSRRTRLQMNAAPDVAPLEPIPEHDDVPPQRPLRRSSRRQQLEIDSNAPPQRIVRPRSGRRRRQEFDAHVSPQRPKTNCTADDVSPRPQTDSNAGNVSPQRTETNTTAGDVSPQRPVRRRIHRTRHEVDEMADVIPVERGRTYRNRLERKDLQDVDVLHLALNYPLPVDGSLPEKYVIKEHLFIPPVFWPVQWRGGSPEGPIEIPEEEPSNPA